MHSYHTEDSAVSEAEFPFSVSPKLHVWDQIRVVQLACTTAISISVFMRFTAPLV